MTHDDDKPATSDGFYQTIDKKTVLDGLNELKRSDRYSQTFGASAHEYQLNPPLSPCLVEEFEGRHDCVLPRDYRIFITEIGNGGAGPYGGVFPFGQHDDGFELCGWESGDLVGDLSEQFAHETAWNASDSIWSQQDVIPSNMSKDEEDQRWEAWQREYWSPNIMAGAIPICHVGCALRQWLVIKGGQRGHVWGDDRADGLGVYPLLTGEGQPVTFADWYMDWLADPTAFGNRKWPNPNVT